MPVLDTPLAQQPSLPEPRGELSEALLAALRREPGEVSLPDSRLSDEPLADEDLQLSLYLLYELHYRDYEGVDPAWEWNASLLAARARLEAIHADALAELVPAERGADPEAVGETLFAYARDDDGPSLSRHLETRGTAAQMRELIVHKSAYQLKEADPHSWVIPRVDGDPKAALLEIQFDEYGSGKPDRIHSRLYAEAMDALGLDSSYGAYLDAIPGSTLATVNLTSSLGLHRGRRGAVVGHLAMFEIGSAIPSRRYGNAIRRLGLASTAAAVEFFDEHVEADSVHENIAAYDLAQRFAVENPHLTDDLLFGARALIAVDGMFAGRVLDRWQGGESSLREPVAAVAG